MLSILAQTLPEIAAPVAWSPHTFTEWFGTVAAFSGLGMVLLILFILVVDKAVLSHLQLGEAMKEKNLAVAILVGSCVIAAAFIIGKAISM